MTKAHKNRIRMIAMVIGGAALLVPLSVSPGGEAPVEITEACADKSCCMEMGSLCEIGDDEILLNRYPTSSTCRVEEQE